MRTSVYKVLPNSAANAVLSPIALRRRREARFRYALFNLSLIDLELDRIQKLLKDDLAMSNEGSFSQIFFKVRHDLDKMRFYLDCGSCDSSFYQYRLEGGSVRRLTLGK